MSASNPWMLEDLRQMGFEVQTHTGKRKAEGGETKSPKKQANSPKAEGGKTKSPKKQATSPKELTLPTRRETLQVLSVFS